MILDQEGCTAERPALRAPSSARASPLIMPGHIPNGWPVIAWYLVAPEDPAG
jgi:hypothetical protein